MNMKLTAIRLPADLLAKLRRRAHLQSLRGDEVTWSALAREAIERFMSESEPAGEDALPSVSAEDRSAGTSPAQAQTEFTVDCESVESMTL